ncbi:MAG: TonB family protein [Cyclobacteriaceae bacterium]
MIEVLNYFIEANIVLLAFGLIYYLLLSKQENFQFRRVFILTAIVCAIITPLLSLNFGQIAISESLSANGLGTIVLPELIVGSPLIEESQSTSINWTFYVLACYGFFFLLFTGRFLFQVFSIWNIVRREKIKRVDDNLLIETVEPLPSFSFFQFLIIGNTGEIDEAEKSQIIAHERVHIRQWHSLDVVLLELMTAIFWINPVIWFFRKSQTDNHEFIVDEEILKQYDKSDYQQLLIKMTVGHIQFVGNYFARIQTLKRINMMNEKRRKPNKLKAGVALASVFLVVTIMACTEEMLEVADSATMTLEIPEAGQDMMAKLKEQYPDVNFIYTEIDVPKDGNKRINFNEIAGIDPKTVRGVFAIEERKKLGLILSPTEEFYKMAEMTKDMNASGSEVYDIVDDQPNPIGGMGEFYKYIGQNMKYPAKARKLGIEGRVFLEFVIDENGNITEVTTRKGIGAGCDAEAERVMKEAKPWNAGKMKGEPVKVRMILPITFKLGNSGTKLKSYKSEAKEVSETKKMEEMVVVGYGKK